ncbi:MAG: response regulator transcription factor [Anaerolineae bacterium]|nr:response regulator transcription factor [Anaerolineae bacterium]
MDKELILLVDDEPNIIDLASLYLGQEGFRLLSAEDGLQALARFEQDAPDFIVLDLMLPRLDGWEVCKRIRSTSDVPILMLTARDDDIDKIVGLELGADDYMTKPFNPRELVARIKAILRRAEPRRNAPQNREAVLQAGNLKIDPARRTVRVGERLVELRTKEFDLLLTLVENESLVFSREKLLEVVWGFDFFGETRTVDVHIAHLRHKLKGSTAIIETVWGVGYKLVVEG